MVSANSSFPPIFPIVYRDISLYHIRKVLCAFFCSAHIAIIDNERTKDYEKTFDGLSKKDEALLFAVQTGISSDLKAGERLRADIVAEDEDACAFLATTEATGVTFALDGIRAEWKIYCIRSAYYIYKNYGAEIYQEALRIIVESWWGDSDSFLSGILHGVTRFVAMYRDEYSRERLIMKLRSVHPKTITKNARKDTGNVADRHMKQILKIYNGSSRLLSLPIKR